MNSHYTSPQSSPSRFWLNATRCALLVGLFAASMVASSGCSDTSSTPTPVVIPRGDSAAVDSIDDAQSSGAAPTGAIWVEDAEGQPVGILFRRGSDDNVAHRAIYDLVTVFHPQSGLFFDVTMTDAVVRHPHTVFFKGFDCDVPVGLSSGGCSDCRAGYGIGIFHRGVWWRVQGGVTSSATNAGSTRSPGLATECVSHGTSNAKAFPLVQVSGDTPPTQLTPPLSLSWR